MTNKTSYILSFLLVLAISCKEHTKINLLGIWAGYSDDFGYGELAIDSSEIKVFTTYMGNGFGHKYQIEKDSIKYDNGYSAKIIILNNDTYVFSSSERIDTLYRLPNSISTYDNTKMSSNNENGKSTFQQFYQEFEDRSVEFRISHKLITKEELDNAKVDSTSEIIYEEILIK